MQNSLESGKVNDDADATNRDANTSSHDDHSPAPLQPWLKPDFLQPYMKGWAKKTSRATFLSPFLAEYASAHSISLTRGKDVIDKAYSAYIKEYHWSLPVDLELGTVALVDDASLTEEGMLMKGKKLGQIKTAIRNYITHHSKKTTSDPDTASSAPTPHDSTSKKLKTKKGPTQKIDSFVQRMTGSSAVRTKLVPWRLWANDNFDAVSHLFDAEFKASGKTWRQQAAERELFKKRYFETQVPSDIQEIYQERADVGNATTSAREEGEAYECLAPVEAQSIIDNASLVMTPAIKAVCEPAGMQGLFFMAGPEPKKGGQVNIIAIELGRDVTRNGRVVSQSITKNKPLFDKISGLLLSHYSACYTKDEQELRALPEHLLSRRDDIDVTMYHDEQPNVNDDDETAKEWGLDEDSGMQDPEPRTSAEPFQSTPSDDEELRRSLAPARRRKTCRRRPPSRGSMQPASPEPSQSTPSDDEEPLRSLSPAHRRKKRRSRSPSQSSMQSGSPRYSLEPSPPPKAPEAPVSTISHGRAVPFDMSLVDPSLLPPPNPVPIAGPLNDPFGLTVVSPTNSVAPTTHSSIHPPTPPVAPPAPPVTSPAAPPSPKPNTGSPSEPVLPAARRNAGGSWEKPSPVAPSVSERPRRRGAGLHRGRGLVCPLPDWLRTQCNAMDDAILGLSWKTLLNNYQAYEEKAGYEDSGAMLREDLRPKELSRWVQGGRKGTPSIPESRIEQFGNTWWDWWKAINENVRNLDGNNPLEITGTWESMDKPGIEGYLPIVMALFCWGLAIVRAKTGELYRSEWENAVSDVSWAFRAMASL